MNCALHRWWWNHTRQASHYEDSNYPSQKPAETGDLGSQAAMGSYAVEFLSAHLSTPSGSADVEFVAAIPLYLLHHLSWKYYYFVVFAVSALSGLVVAQKKIHG